MLTGAVAIYVQQHMSWWLLIPVLLLHGTVCAFMSNAEHELVHGTVFRQSWLNGLFLRVFGFLRWFPYDFYWASHTEHHKFTLYPPQDQEVLLPQTFTLAEFLKTAFVDPVRMFGAIKSSLRYARGKLDKGWESYVLARDPARFSVFRWARILLAGHCFITVVSLYYGYWIIPVVVSFTPLYGGWLIILCNAAQHAGLKDKTPDFRLNTRTMYLNPVVQFLNWYMNFHAEHHMYAAVPCYNLRRLHEAIKHDCPPATNGLLATWRQMIAIQRRQEVEPGYQYVPPLPGAGKEGPLRRKLQQPCRLRTLQATRTARLKVAQNGFGNVRSVDSSIRNAWAYPMRASFPAPHGKTFPTTGCARTAGPAKRTSRWWKSRLQRNRRRHKVYV